MELKCNLSNVYFMLLYFSVLTQALSQTYILCFLFICQFLDCWWVWFNYHGDFLGFERWLIERISQSMIVGLQVLLSKIFENFDIPKKLELESKLEFRKS